MTGSVTEQEDFQDSKATLLADAGGVPAEGDAESIGGYDTGYLVFTFRPVFGAACCTGLFGGITAEALFY